MLVFTCKYLRKAFMVDRRLFSSMKKYAKPIITQDEQIIFPDEDEDEDIPIVKETTSKIRRGSNIFESYNDKCFEKIESHDERLGQIILNARILSDMNNNSLVIEGVNMIRDAIRLNATLTHLYFTKREILAEIPMNTYSKDANIYYISYKTMKKFSNLSTPPGIIAVFKRPDSTEMLVDPFLGRKLPITLILDNVRDPGNLGCIIRSAAGFNIHRIFMTKGCVDLYNDKVLRSSMSSIFCIPIFQNLTWNDIQNALSPDCVVHYADIKNDTGESFPYYDENLVDFTKNKTYGLVIGGEINGVSEDAKRVSAETYGCCLHIPIASRVNSLNMTVAGAIIMAEFQKRILKNKIYIN